MRDSISAATIFILIFSTVSSLAETITPPCERSVQIVHVLERRLGKACRDIIHKDLLDIEELRINNWQGLELKNGDFSGLTNLQTLNLNGNEIVELPENLFSSLTNLRTLDIEHNSIRTLPPKIFKELIRLKDLAFGFNRISHLPADLFKTNSSLRKLFMEANAFQSIEPGTFDALPELTVLNMTSIEYIPDSAFVHNPKLLSLNIFNSPLTRTSPAAFKGVIQIDGLPDTFNVDPEFDWEGQ